MNKGFTMIELMITVAILGIIAAIAIPMYSGYTTKSKMSEAQEELLNVKTLMEQRLIDTRTGYTSNLTDLPGRNVNPKYYTFSLTVVQATSCFTIRATGDIDNDGFQDIWIIDGDRCTGTGKPCNGGRPFHLQDDIGNTTATLTGCQ